jgi:nitric oxide reductase NorD protein
VAEPEGLLVEGARRAAVVARELWWRARPPAARATVPLAHVKRRLELFLAALFDDAPALLPADAPPAPTWLARVLGRAPRHLEARRPLAATDGVSVWLPRAIDATDAAGVAAYRLWAVQQTARARRGTAAYVPRDPLERDLYGLAEAAAVDAALARALPGLAPELRAARARALQERAASPALTGAEAAVERLVRGALAADVAEPPDGMPRAAGPPASLAWARSMAQALRGRARYRGVAPVALWGELRRRPTADVPEAAVARDVADPRRPPRAAPLRRTPRVRQRAADEDDASPGTWMVRADDPMESAEDPAGLQRPLDRDDEADAADLADSVSELPEARVVHTPGAPREILESEAVGVARARTPRGGEAAGAAIVYPEWDYRLSAYREAAVVVHTGEVVGGAATWVEAVMTRHAALVRGVRRRFETLRPQRVKLGRQPDGAELDVAAYVAAFADWRALKPADDRLYVAARRARRDLAIVLLVDVSASTDSWVAGSLRIIDVEKESLVVLLEALDAVGDRHAALAFSGEGPRGVRVATVKAFDERAGAVVRRRVAGLEPDGYTRVGAALRHASALLAGQMARHRLLLLLSDGKPNDVDAYDGRYGIEDTRQAVAEARLQGIVPFCLTVDRGAPAYMPSLFGPRGYTMLRRQELLPAVVVEVVRRLLAR